MDYHHGKNITFIIIGLMLVGADYSTASSDKGAPLFAPIGIILILVGSLQYIKAIWCALAGNARFSGNEIAAQILSIINRNSDVTVEVSYRYVIINGMSYGYNTWGYASLDNPEQFRNYLYAHMKRKSLHRKINRRETDSVTGSYVDDGRGHITQRTIDTYNFMIIPKKRGTPLKRW